MTFVTAGRSMRAIVLLVAFALSFFLANNRTAFADPLGSDIVCHVFNTLTGVGAPISPMFGGNCPGSPPPATPPACSDGIDNDGDGLVDSADPGCQSANDSDESNAPPAQEAKLVVVAVVINDNAGTSTVSQFQLYISTSTPEAGITVLSGATTTVAPGTWSVGEVQKLGYAGSFGGDCNAQGHVSLAAGELKTCSIVNDDIPPAPAPAVCADGVDNDNDGLIDLADPGCSSATDSDETNTPQGSSNGGVTSNAGGGGGGSGGGSGSYGGGGGPPIGYISGASSSGSSGIVLGMATTALPYSKEEIAECDRYLSSFIGFGKKNNTEQVTRLQKFLRDFEGAKLSETGIYDSASLAAVHAFQTKYAGDILIPWGIKASTGYVYLTTRKKVNEIFCRNTRAFLLAPDELQKIAEARASLPASQTSSSSPQSSIKMEKDSRPSSTTSAAVTSAKVQTTETSSAPLRGILDFMRRVLGK